MGRPGIMSSDFFLSVAFDRIGAIGSLSASICIPLPSVWRILLASRSRLVGLRCGRAGRRCWLRGLHL
jgi:hypothetical protein